MIRKINFYEADTMSHIYNILYTMRDSIVIKEPISFDEFTTYTDSIYIATSEPFMYSNSPRVDGAICIKRIESDKAPYYEIGVFYVADYLYNDKLAISDELIGTAINDKKDFDVMISFKNQIDFDTDKALKKHGFNYVNNYNDLYTYLRNRE